MNLFLTNYLDVSYVILNFHNTFAQPIVNTRLIKQFNQLLFNLFNTNNLINTNLLGCYNKKQPKRNEFYFTKTICKRKNRI